MNEEIVKLNKAVNEFAEEMKRKLIKQYLEKGYMGWDNENMKAHIKDRLTKNFCREDYIDVANYSMMLHRFKFNENKIVDIKTAYLHDSKIHYLVDALEDAMLNLALSPTEIQDCLKLAISHFELNKLSKLKDYLK